MSEHEIAVLRDLVSVARDARLLTVQAAHKDPSNQELSDADNAAMATVHEAEDALRAAAYKTGESNAYL